VPKDVNWQLTIVENLFVVFPTANFKLDSASNYVDETIECEISKSNGQALLKGIVGQVGKLVSTLDVTSATTNFLSG
jgi:hypothetical protein